MAPPSLDSRVEGFTDLGRGPPSTRQRGRLRIQAPRDKAVGAGSPKLGQLLEWPGRVSGLRAGIALKGVDVSALTPGTGSGQWVRRPPPGLGRTTPHHPAGLCMAPRLTRWYAAGRGRWLAGRGHRCPQTSAAGTPRSRAWLAALQRLSGPDAHLLKQSRGPPGCPGCGRIQGHHGSCQAGPATGTSSQSNIPRASVPSLGRTHLPPYPSPWRQYQKLQ